MNAHTRETPSELVVRSLQVFCSVQLCVALPPTRACFGRTYTSCSLHDSTRVSPWHLKCTEPKPSSLPSSWVFHLHFGFLSANCATVDYSITQIRNLGANFDSCFSLTHHHQGLSILPSTLSPFHFCCYYWGFSPETRHFQAHYRLLTSLTTLQPPSSPQHPKVSPAVCEIIWTCSNIHCGPAHGAKWKMNKRWAGQGW